MAGADVSAGSTTATTDSNGRYTLADLTPGQYVVSVVHQDYDPGLSPILSLGPGKLMPNLELFPTDETPYPEDPMLTNPLDPNGAPTADDAERLAREQGLTGEVASVDETTLTGEYLVNYKGHYIGLHRIDLVVEGKVIVELKAVAGKLQKVHIAQTVSERQVSNLPVALLVYFGDTSVQVRRLEMPE